MALHGHETDHALQRRTTIAAWWVGLSSLAVVLMARVPYLTTTCGDPLPVGRPEPTGDRRAVGSASNQIGLDR